MKKIFDDFAKILDVSDEWFVYSSNINSRHFYTRVRQNNNKYYMDVVLSATQEIQYSLLLTQEDYFNTKWLIDCYELINKVSIEDIRLNGGRFSMEELADFMSLKPYWQYISPVIADNNYSLSTSTLIVGENEYPITYQQYMGINWLINAQRIFSKTILLRK